MLRVRLEMVPGGDESRACDIGSVHIWNMVDHGIVAGDTADYAYLISDHDGGDIGGGTVREHRRVDGAWALVHKALGAFQKREPTIAHQEAAPKASKE
jgi:hypothetical protein